MVFFYFKLKELIAGLWQLHRRRNYKIWSFCCGIFIKIFESAKGKYYFSRKYVIIYGSYNTFGFNQLNQF